MRQQHPAEDIARPDRPPRLRPSEAVWAAAGAVLVHVVVLGAWAADRTLEGLRWAASLEVPASAVTLASPLSHRVVPVEVRSLLVPSSAAPHAGLAPVLVEHTAARVTLPPGPRSGPAPGAVPAAAPAAPASEAPRSFDVPAQTSSMADAPAAALLAAAQPTESRAATAADDDPPPPVYSTRVPPPFRMSYALRRGALSGQAELTLLRAGTGYELELKGTALGLEVLGLRSQGGLGPHGLMPERFVDRRRGKDRLAANFDHGAGRITYSGSAASQPLRLGAQDRLSWMVQLAAVLEAAPARHGAGSRIALSVSGARADVDTWTFIVQDRQRLNLPGGAVVDALRLMREPRRPYDTQVEVWMDPAQHHLPVRARLTVLPGGETLELSSSGN
ncbi:MAG: DUF3108 domain-containing protein [Betaproteobacteria bacterium]